MARIRTIKPEFGHHEKLSEVSAEVHLFAALLLTHADDDGYFHAHPKLLHSAVCPLRELSLSIHDILTELSRIGYVELFTGSDGREYGQIVNFLKHQRVSRPTPSKIKYLREDSVRTHGGLSEPSMSPPEKKVPPARAQEVEVEVEVEVEKELQGPEVTNHIEAIANKIPADMPALNYALKIIDDLAMPNTVRNALVIEAAIKALIKAGKSDVSAYEFLAAQAKDAMDRGDPIDKFWFEDQKWRRNGNGTQRGRQIDEAIRRAAATDS